MTDVALLADLTYSVVAMPEINPPVEQWVADNNATCIQPLPSADPNQRGPSCGFYALAFVMAYWHGKDNQNPSLPARTHNVDPSQRQASATQVRQKRTRAEQGQFSSLRQYGKFYSLTAYGSVFNAENLVQVARGAGSQYGGHYDGKVIVTTDVSDFVNKVKALIANDCPVIVPFDVGSTGDPELHTGTRAHWTVICGWCDRQGVDWFLHRHWGKYRESKADDFALSCQSLTSNALLEFEKTEVRHPTTGTVIKRDWMTASNIDDYKKQGWATDSLGKKGVNLEFTNPMDIKQLPQRIPDPNENIAEFAAKSIYNFFADTPWDAPNIQQELKKHGFQPQNVGNNGLRSRIVSIYPQGTNITV